MGDKEVTYSVFVYGTLKKGRGNHAHYLADARFVGKAHTTAPFMMFGHGFPLARLPNESDNHWFAAKVRGEVYEVSMEELRCLDSLEGHPHFYKRTLTAFDEYPDTKVWMYHWNERDGRLDGSLCVPRTEKFGRDRIHDW